MGSESPNLQCLLSNKTVGTYKCVVSASAFDSIETKVNIAIRGPPRILKLESKFETYENPGQITCEVRSPIKELSIVWEYNGILLSQDGGGSGLAIVESEGVHVMRSTILIKHVRKQHIGTYSCIAMNPVGVVEKSLQFEITGNNK